MLKSSILIFLCLIAVKVQAQLPVKLTGTLVGWKNGSLISLVSYQGYIIDTTRLSRGAFSFSENIPGGDYYMLKINEVKKPEDSLLIYLDAGSLSLHSTRNKRMDTRFTGGLYARELDSFYSAFRSYPQPGKKRSQRIRFWIGKHRSSPVSVFAIDRYLSSVGTAVHWSELNYLYTQLKTRALDNILALRLGLTIERLNTLESGKIFPDFTLPDSTGALIGLNKEKGKYQLIDFWASWCGPCRQENPHFKELAKRYADKNFSLVSISLDKDRVAWVGAIKTDHLNWKQLIDSKFPHSALSEALNLKMIPADFLLDPQGKIIAKSLFGKALDDELDRILVPE